MASPCLRRREAVEKVGTLGLRPPASREGRLAQIGPVIGKWRMAGGEWRAEGEEVELLNVDFNTGSTECAEIRGRGRKR